MSGYSTDQLPDSNGYNLHARLIGAIPHKSEDLFVSIMMGIVFWVAMAVGIWRWMQKRDDIFPFKTNVLLGVSISCFFLGLGFFVRAGLADTDQAKRKRSTYIAEQIFFVLASLIWVDFPVLTITRDVVYLDVLEADAQVTKKPLEWPLPKPPKHWFSRFTMLARLLTILAGVLYFYGFGQLPNPGDRQPPSKKSSNLRLAASLIIFLLVLLNLLAFAFHVVIIRFFDKAALKGRLLALFLNLFVFVTALYNFVIVAVTDDYSPLFDSKVFFYFAYAFFPAWLVAACIVIEVGTWSGTRGFKYIVV